MEQSRETSKIKYTRHRKKTNNEEWNSPEKLARLGTQDTGQRQTKQKNTTQNTKRMNSSKILDKGQRWKKIKGGIWRKDVD